MNPNIEVALEQAILASREPRTGEREGFYMSSLGQCPRSQILARAGVPPTNPPTSRAIRKMWLGTMFGKALQTSLAAVGYLDPTWEEKRVTYRSYRGKVDGYTPHIPGGAIVELKTADDDAITRYAMPEHYAWQGLAYCVATGIPNLLLFQVGKSQGLCRHQVLTVDDTYRRTLDNEITRMDGFWTAYQADKSLPAHDHRFKWQDKTCDALTPTEVLA